MSNSTTPFDALMKDSLHELYDLYDLQNGQLPEARKTPDDFLNDMENTMPTKVARTVLSIKVTTWVLVITLLVVGGLVAAFFFLGDNQTQNSLDNKESGAQELSQSKSEVDEVSTPISSVVEQEQSQNPVDKITKAENTTTTTTSTLPDGVTGPPKNIQVVGYDKNSSPTHWYVNLEWNPSQTASVSYCVGRSADSWHNCFYDEANLTTSTNYAISKGETQSITYYIFAITPQGVVSEPATVSYAVPG